MTRCHCEARLPSVIARHNVPKQSRGDRRDGFLIKTKKVEKMNDLELNITNVN